MSETKPNEVYCAEHPHSGAEFEPTPRLPHYGKMVCPQCRRWLAWVKKPENEKRNRRESQKHHRAFTSAGVDYCQMCLRKRDELPPGMSFTVHHIVEIQDGGLDEPENTWHLCHFCHEMIHLLRRNRVNPKDRPETVAVWW